jgi:general secretion pathway protein M
MNLLNTLTSLLSRFPTAAAIFYLGVVVSLGITAWTAMAQIQDRRDEVADTAATLAQLEGRTPAATPRRRTGDGEPLMAGSPLLEGATMTVATAIAKLGGSIQYTQVDLEGPQAKDGFVSVTVNCEVTQPALQQLLYDLEAGMPFLFIDQLVAQGPATQVAATPGGPEPKLRVLISVSGQWQGQASK